MAIMAAGGGIAGDGNTGVEAAADSRDCGEVCGHFA